MSASNFFHTALPAIFSMFWLLFLCLLFFMMAVLKWALHGEEIVHVHHLLQFVRREMVHCQGTVAALESGYIQGSNTCSCTSVHVLCVANNPKHPHWLLFWRSAHNNSEIDTTCHLAIWSSCVPTMSAEAIAETQCLDTQQVSPTSTETFQ